MNTIKKRLVEISKGCHVPANTKEILSILTKWPKVTLLEKPTDLLQMWELLIRTIYNSSQAWELLEAALYFENHPHGPNLVFTSQGGSVAERNGVQRWNSLDILNCDLEDPNLLELLAGMAKLMAAPLHELRIKVGREWDDEYNTKSRWYRCIDIGRRFRCEHAHKKYFDGSNNKESTASSKESITTCLVTLLQSIKGFCVIEIHSRLEHRNPDPESIEVDWVAVV
ncbi:expressed unknown protein [Seminavis robusta]|uniref:Uncharacterized protein n=1 Tax=Seminavis robusta TaxID=568900 RepID=A0A9N8HWB9_9STRA|nr:expressed unknown protein [Seminavis robusta]|eukprot:Sro1949_g307310.1 n/a (226) ;mRNA; f:11275-11952